MDTVQDMCSIDFFIVWTLQALKTTIWLTITYFAHPSCKTTHLENLTQKALLHKHDEAFVSKSSVFVQHACKLERMFFRDSWPILHGMFKLRWTTSFPVWFPRYLKEERRPLRQFRVALPMQTLNLSTRSLVRMHGSLVCTHGHLWTCSRFQDSAWECKIFVANMCFLFLLEWSQVSQKYASLS